MDDVEVWCVWGPFLLWDGVCILPFCEPSFLRSQSQWSYCLIKVWEFSSLTWGQEQFREKSLHVGSE